jgi:amidohydrolase
MKNFLFTSLFIFLFVQLYAQNDMARLKDRASLAADKIESKCIEWRRKLHEHPELGNREFNTAKLIATHLKTLGIEVKENVAKTGVVGILRGGKPGPCIGLRADMDALPIV